MRDDGLCEVLWPSHAARSIATQQLRALCRVDQGELTHDFGCEVLAAASVARFYQSSQHRASGTEGELMTVMTDEVFK